MHVKHVNSSNRNVPDILFPAKTHLTSDNKDSLSPSDNEIQIPFETPIQELHPQIGRHVLQITQFSHGNRHRMTQVSDRVTTTNEV